MSAIASAPFSAQVIAAEGLKPPEYETLVQGLGRHPNRAELGMFGVMWSEHCCYKNSRPLLAQFPTTGERIVVGPGENAGVVDLGDGLQLALKVESHNHPSAIEPYQGAATGVGGILRDIFTLGARPIALLDSLRFGSLEDARARRLFAGVVEGIAGYGNSVGVPTVGGEVYFDPAFSGNPLVNVMALGLVETEGIVRAGASGIGNPVIYAGATTGRDGMGGASFASAELSADASDDHPAVQVGDPFTEKALIEACLEAFQTGAVVAAQDMGAAGLTCSSAEMAAKGRVGIELDLDRVPAREAGMGAYEYLLSESQERMLLVAQQGREAELTAILQRWGLHATVAGAVLAEPVVRVRFQGGVAAEVPARALTDDAPTYHRSSPSEPPAYAQAAWQWQPHALPPATRSGLANNRGELSWRQILLQLLDDPTVAPKRWVYRQYDHQVQNNTVALPGAADAAVLRARPQGAGQHIKRGIAATTDCNARYVYLDPEEGAKAAVAEAARNLSCVGADPLAVTDNLNFGSPETEVGYWQLSAACRGIAIACQALETPVASGNVSLYNETIDAQGTPQPVTPTPAIGMVGSLPDVTQACGSGWQAPGDAIYLLGDGAGGVTLGGSQYLAAVGGQCTGRPPRVDLALERQVQQACRTGIRAGYVRSAHDCAEGGLAVAVAEACLGGGLGAEINLGALEADRSELRWDALLFGEAASRILVAVPPEHQAAWEAELAQQLPRAWYRLGAVCSERRGLRLLAADGDAVLDASLEVLAHAADNALARRLQEPL
ncbi:MAG: phosphoribosylformylglycinamidine synthase subunit PurL [Cyanobacteria bacterium QS_8_64_29]|nr:MAG: phosphoribosylformylglycinamidine synthase subunit PurL [Cyanobacteria bacterium QS_8_64_29]